MLVCNFLLWSLKLRCFSFLTPRLTFIDKMASMVCSVQTQTESLNTSGKCLLGSQRNLGMLWVFFFSPKHRSCPLLSIRKNADWRPLTFQTHELCPSFILPKLANTGQLFKCWAECCVCARALRMLRENLEEEAVIMKDVPGWKVRS